MWTSSNLNPAGTPCLEDWGPGNLGPSGDTEIHTQYQLKVWTQILIQGFFFIFTILYIVKTSLPTQAKLVPTSHPHNNISSASTYTMGQKSI
jgi:hypothetical protein